MTEVPNQPPPDDNGRPQRAGGWRRSKWLWLGLVLVLLAGAGFGLAREFRSTSQTHAISGVVRCASGAAVVGVWIADNPLADWADWDPEPGRPSVARYEHPIIGSSYSAHVGCGGTVADWGVEVRSPMLDKAEIHLLCFDALADGRPVRCEVEG